MSENLSKPPPNRITVSGEFKNLKKILGFVQKAVRKAGFSEAENYKIQLAVDEAFTNIIEHAYGAEKIGDIECLCEYKDPDITIQLIDFGHPFDPRSIETPNLNANLMDRKTGGLGLYFIHQLMDEVRFYSIPENAPIMNQSFSPRPCNVLVMVKRRGNQHDTSR
jgi:anti-sigma regulatory factor (Ser/Thr protein kinase)